MTGFDIIFFWAARMIMFGLEFMGDVPFRQVHIHGLVRDAERQKMSKTKGNTIDPLVINDKYGTDAVRFALLVSAAPGGDIALSEDRIDALESLRQQDLERVAAAVQQAARRFGQAGVAGRPLDRQPPERLRGSGQSQLRAASLRSRPPTQLYHFWWDDFCDWYLELKKLDDGLELRLQVYEKALRLLHPLMPFLTEELWQRLEMPGKSIALAEYPRYSTKRSQRRSRSRDGNSQGDRDFGARDARGQQRGSEADGGRDSVRAGPSVSRGTSERKRYLAAGKGETGFAQRSASGSRRGVRAAARISRWIARRLPRKSPNSKK